MSTKQGTVYMIRKASSDDPDDEWVQPEPADEVIVDAVVGASDLAAEDLDDVDSYVDLDDLAAVVGDGDAEEISFTVEGHDVVVTADGAVDVETE